MFIKSSYMIVDIFFWEIYKERKSWTKILLISVLLKANKSDWMAYFIISSFYWIVLYNLWIHAKLILLLFPKQVSNLIQRK